MFLCEVPPSRFTIHETVKKCETTGSVANKKRNRKHTVLTEETLDEIGASLERTPTKSIPKEGHCDLAEIFIFVSSLYVLTTLTRRADNSLIRLR